MTDRATSSCQPAVPLNINEAFLDPAFAARDAEVLAAFDRAAMVDPAILDRIPHGATLVLLLEGEPEYLERRFAFGVAAIHQGRDVVFRQVCTAGTPNGGNIPSCPV